MQRLFALAILGITTLQLLDGTFISIKQTPLSSNVFESEMRKDFQYSRQIFEDSKGGCRRRCSRSQKHLQSKIARLDLIPSKYYRSRIPANHFVTYRCTQRATGLQQSPTPIESKTLYFDRFARVPRRELYPRDVIFCGDERIPFLRAAFGNNDNVEAKVTFG